MLLHEDWNAIFLTLKLAFTTTAILFAVGLPIAWWLARTRGMVRNAVAAVVAVPLVLPPSVLGFYLLMAMGPAGPLGRLTEWLGIGALPFTFAGLVVASVLYSMPFMVQPLQSAFESMGTGAMEAAATLGASPLDRFFTVAVPMCLPGILVAGVMTFTHTIGEFGVVLMLGGNIPGVSRVVSVQIYDHVEAFEYGRAHALAAVLLVFSFAVLFLMQRLRSKGVGA
ncbi:MAG: transporter, permease [Fibrobacterota bacterium]|jgi:molybdate transport system permease protein